VQFWLACAVHLLESEGGRKALAACTASFGGQIWSSTVSPDEACCSLLYRVAHVY
jgi:hypothetical protein